MDNRINFVSLGHAVTGVLSNLLRAIGTVDFSLIINTTALVNRETVKLLREKNIAGINRLFCTNSRNAGILTRQVTKDTPDNRLQMNNFGAPADDFFQFRLDNNTLYYSCPALDEGWQTDGHQFILSNGEYHFAG
jgi:hypothetical protein